MIKLMVIEQYNILADSLSKSLNSNDKFLVVKTCTDTESALLFLQKNEVDVVITELFSCDEGESIVKKLKSNLVSPKVIVLSRFAQSGHIKKVLDEGVDGYISKCSPFEDLVDAVEGVDKGEVVIDSKLAIIALRDKDPLSSTEKRLLRLVGRNMSNREIAKAVCLGEGTVRNYISVAMSKLYTTNRAAAFKKARQSGWL